MLSRKPRSPSNEDALLDAELEDLFLYLWNAPFACVGVAVVVDSKPLLETLY